MIYWIFGIPGSGKSTVAKQFSELSGMPVFEGDDFQTEEDREVIAAGVFTLERRHAQLSRIMENIDSKGPSRAIVTHPLPDRESRTRVLGVNGEEGKLVYGKAPLSVIEERLIARRGHHFGPDLLDAWIPRHWQEPTEEGLVVIENGLDQQLLNAQLKALNESINGI